MRRVHFWLAVAAVLLIAGALRFHALGADPSEAVGRVFLSDEGWWAHNARNHYLFGAWVLDDWKPGSFWPRCTRCCCAPASSGLASG